MKLLVIISCLFILNSTVALADPERNCEASAGNYLTGLVVKAPFFKHGQFKKGIELSHTHLSLKADQDGKIYDVAIDNVFAADYIENSKSIPSSLSQIQINDRLELCGLLYSKGTGIHWVHTNCGEAPTPQHPDGWLKIIESSRPSSLNLESNTQYCYLWSHRKRMLNYR